MNVLTAQRLYELLDASQPGSLLYLSAAERLTRREFRDLVELAMLGQTLSSPTPCRILPPHLACLLRESRQAQPAAGSALALLAERQAHSDPAVRLQLAREQVQASVLDWVASGAEASPVYVLPQEAA